MIARSGRDPTVATRVCCSVRNAAHQLPRLVVRSEEHTSELQSRVDIVCRLLLEKKKKLLRNALADSCTRRATTILNALIAGCLKSLSFIANYLHGSGHHGYFFFNDTATTEIYTLSLHDALPI